MLSKTCTYAIKAMIYVCGKSIQNEKVGVKVIAQEIQSPEPFTGKILQNLSKRRLISSNKGPNGGFYMTEKQQQIKLLDIILSLEGNDILTKCRFGFERCTEKYPCPLHSYFVPIKEAYLKEFKEISVLDLSDKVEKGMAFFYALD